MTRLPQTGVHLMGCPGCPGTCRVRCLRCLRAQHRAFSRGWRLRVAAGGAPPGPGAGGRGCRKTHCRAAASRPRGRAQETLLRILDIRRSDLTGPHRNGASTPPAGRSQRSFPGLSVAVGTFRRHARCERFHLEPGGDPSADRQVPPRGQPRCVTPVTPAPCKRRQCRALLSLCPRGAPLPGARRTGARPLPLVTCAVSNPTSHGLGGSFPDH